MQIEETPDLARVAGESLSLITGVDIAGEDPERDAPDGFETGPNERPEDEDVAMDPDEDPPWPDLEPIRAWGEANSGRFRAGTHYLAGQPVSETWCRHILEAGEQRQRNAAALELALLRPDALCSRPTPLAPVSNGSCNRKRCRRRYGDRTAALMPRNIPVAHGFYGK